MFDNRSSGVVTFSNGDRIHYKYDVDLLYSIIVWLDGEDIRRKYKMGALKTLDADSIFAGSNDDFSETITIPISCFKYIDINSNQLYIVAKRK